MRNIELPNDATNHSPLKNNASALLSPHNDTTLTRGVYASPTYRTSTHNILSNQINNKYMNPNPFGRAASVKSDLVPQNDSIFYRPPKSNPIIEQDKLLESKSAKDMGPRKNLSLVVNSSAGLHNPITNPVPYNVQNPYILRGMHSVRSQNNKSGFLANVASTNIFAS